MIYCSAILKKNAGLGARLLPWARCRIFSRINKIPMLSPVWFQLRIGPLLRRESDLQWYHNLFIKKKTDIAGMKRLWLQYTVAKEPEPEIYEFSQRTEPAKDTIVVFEGPGDFFNKLNGWDQFLHEEIRIITRECWLKKVDKVKEVPIGINIRRAGFKEPESEEDFFIKGSLKTPMRWFIKSLETIRKELGFRARAFVCSDAGEKELQDILNLKDVFLFRGGSAVSDLLLLSRAKVLIASGGSNFSAWASFLGQTPTIIHPGQSLGWFNLKNQKGYYAGCFDPDSPPAEFMKQVKEIL